MRQRGRKFEDWVFEMGPRKITVECRTEPVNGQTTFFVENGDYGIGLSNVDPNKLKKDVRAFLENIVVEDWTYFMKVTTTAEQKRGDDDTVDGEAPQPCLTPDPKKPDRAYRTINVCAGLRVEVEVFRRTTINGKDHYEHWWYGKWTKSTWDGDYRPTNVGTDEEDRARAVAIVDITDENLQALQNIIRSITQLQALVAEVLSPRRIEDTLKSAGTFLPKMPELPALPSPPVKPAKKRKRT